MGIDKIEKISKGLGVLVEKLLTARGYGKDSFQTDERETAPFCKERQEEK